MAASHSSSLLSSGSYHPGITIDFFGSSKNLSVGSVPDMLPDDMDVG